MKLLAGFEARPATIEDAAGVATVIAACETAHSQNVTTTADVVRYFWSTVDLASQAIVIEASGGEIVASAEIDNRDYVSISVHGHVHPAFCDRGLGSYIVQWAERWLQTRNDLSPEGQTRTIHYLVAPRNESARRLLIGAGYAEVRRSLTMGIELSVPPAPANWPDGVSRSFFVPDRDEREVYEAIEDAFQDVWGRPRSSFERFLQNRPGRWDEGDLWVIARSGADIAGVSLGKMVGETGWIDNVGVLRAWRRRGIGLALLRESFRVFYVRGVRDVRLSVDASSLTGAPRLYERAGMVSLSEELLYEKTI